MKFLVQLVEEDHFARWEQADAATRERFFEVLRAFHTAVEERGSVVAGEGLAAPDRAVTLRGEDVTEGPYAESTEQLGGFYVVDLPSLEVAVETARILATLVTVEVRETVEE
jgi:hypothetical protein